MDYKGKLVRWNIERGFGFIQCEQLEKDVFIHISTLKSSLGNEKHPTIGVNIIFRLAVENDGKHKAYQAFIEGAKVAKVAKVSKSSIKVSKRNSRTFSRIMQAIASLVIIFILVDRAYYNMNKPEPFKPSGSISPKLSQPLAKKEEQTYIFPKYQSQGAIEQDFKCDGRQYCSQMTSCAEAKYFIKNCPKTKMDGDNDGIPCESQWCKYF